ncbi:MULTISPECIES: RBBP9/YdeN family alpha/beta hydrolase [Afifella]|uniref:RBBP9/YdeN family alpha/beta hydrolase n=1 Tax=Afifella TaxID=643217 RepID=UPI000FE3F8E9|nr:MULTISPECIES: alpha/beta fold hydrolase [Afifella]MCF1503270.1 alpha/beta fold hydrolase [Afifella sp. H1R]
MKAREADILIHPGLYGPKPDNWYARWARQIGTAEMIEQDWSRPDRSDWTANLIAAVKLAKRPVVLVGHSAGALTIVHAAAHLAGTAVRAAFLVTPPDFDLCGDELPEGRTFLPVPREPMPFPTLVVASRSDPYCAFETSEDWAAAWGALFIDGGESGHMNSDSGHGPWPEGLMVFARMMGQL